MWADPYDLAGLDDGMTPEQIKTLVANYSPDEVAKILSQQSGGQAASVQPTTQQQIVNLASMIAQGILDIEKAKAQTKLSAAQEKAAAEASKVAAQNYVMQQLQQGKSVLLPQNWLQAYQGSSGWIKWATPVLVIGGVALLGYAIYRYAQGRRSATPAAVAANPRSRRRKSRR